MPRTRTSAQRTGDAAEALVAERLAADGWTILGRNVRVGRAEIDLVGVDPGPPGQLVVVEVRFRARRDFGLAEETITHRKRRLLHDALARLRLADGTLPRLPARFDLIVVEPGREAWAAATIRHHRHAF